ncbi:hypothetical protein NP233_g1416 [Leucocoprinus birnbaumii]|uniref:BUB1 N-terminal domain-containing protein n=1 Tax=Leucocoprinus birnbaumii TaxID=56174 RepID=A0AAD5W044_9AGAR|nr:hypothetical protein NP233_g1416 [Leucocoprinus birnbaumii]
MLSSEDDVFSSSGPPIIDCDVLEAAKENVQPLGTGRRVTALSAILSTPHAQREAKLQSTRNRLRINVELALASDADDNESQDFDMSNTTNALDAYWNFVNWTLDNYPQGNSAESGLLELLEEATRVLKDHDGGKWRKDIKYLKLWLLYASYVEKPVVIYRFLVVNEIGTNWALLYEEYAAVLERDGRRKEADEAYSLGIARKASPLEHLQERYNDFQKRMMSNMMLPPAPPPSTTLVSSQKPRAALATTSIRPPAPASSSTATRQTPRSVSTPMSASTTSNSRLQIFVDPSGSSSQTDDPSSDAWNDLGTRKTRVKEKRPRGEEDGRSGSSRSGAGGRSVSGGFAIFRDPGPNEETNDSATTMPPPSLIPKAKGGGSGPPKGSGGSSVPKTPAKGSFTPFVDDSSAPSSGVTSATAQGHPATPKPMTFTPFRDETTLTPATTTATIGLTDSVIKVKKAGPKAPILMSSEAEALRKDPLKNYEKRERELGITGGGADG